MLWAGSVLSRLLFGALRRRFVPTSVDLDRALQFAAQLWQSLGEEFSRHSLRVCNAGFDSQRILDAGSHGSRQKRQLVNFLGHLECGTCIALLSVF